MEARGEEAGPAGAAYGGHCPCGTSGFTKELDIIMPVTFDLSTHHTDVCLCLHMAVLPMHLCLFT